MKRIALCGKANSGKNLTASKIAAAICDKNRAEEAKMLAFANPIKSMVLNMFPWANRDYLYGASKLRNNIIPNITDKEGKPLTYRQVLIDLGSQGRTYNFDHWIEVYDYTVRNLTKEYNRIVNDTWDIPPNIKCILCSDVRYRNEFEYLKSNGYFQIKIFRKSDITINDSSETNQDSIKNEEFDYVLDNNGSLEDLDKNIEKIVSAIRKT